MDHIFSVVTEKVVNLAADGAKLLFGTEENAKRLVFKLKTIRPYLHDAEVRATNDPSVRDWLTTLRTALDEADDVIDVWNTKSQQSFTSQNAVSNFFTQPALCYDIGKKIEGINNELTDIANTVNSFNFLKNPVVPGRGKEALAPYDAILKARMTDSTKENVIGRGEEIKDLREKLVGVSFSEKSEIIVISVFGPPGYGKTSLAKHMFHEVGNHFRKKIWVYAPDILDEKTVIKKMLDALKRETSLEDLEGLKNVLVDEFLNNNRLLLVIDDIWKVDPMKWLNLYNIFNNVVTKGSRILVTTRNEKVAKVVCSAQCTMRVEPLSSEISLSILRNNSILEGKDEGEISDLMKIGKQIVEKCGCVPLAIITIASALRSKNTRDGWQGVLESKMWKWQSESIGGILPALWLSYCHLSPQLKSCFRYCAIYSKGDMIVKEEVVPKWVALGYILEEEGRENEDIGMEYFDELVGCSLFQDAKWDIYGNIVECRMHDLVLELVQFVTKGEVLVIEESKNKSVSTELRHCRILDGGSIDKSYINTMGRRKRLRTLSSSEKSTCSFIEKLQGVRVLELRSVDEFPPAICDLVHLRYLCLRETSIKVLPHSIGQLWNLQYLDLCETNIKKLPESFKHLSNLRYLDLSHTDLSLLPSSIIELNNLRHLSLKSSKISEIPEHIGSLNLLRSLDLSDTKVSKLPESIANLSHLQELLLDCCFELSMLPKGICQLTGLKKLGNGSTYKLRGLPEGIGRLTNLKRLDKFVVVKKDGGEGSSNMEELKQLNNLCGGLSIGNLEDVGSEEEAASADLELKTRLTDLLLEYSADQPTNSDAVLQALRPPFGLRQLQIIGVQGSKLPTWLECPSFSGLHKLYLSSCFGCTTLPALGNLPELRKLNVSRMRGVTMLNSDLFGSMHGFPKLESLEFEDMNEWQEWQPLANDGRIFTFPCLREFKISNCPNLRSLPPIFSASLQNVDIGVSMELSNQEWSFLGTVHTLSCGSAEWLNGLPSLPNLRRLLIEFDDVVSELSNSLLKFSSLQTLKIHWCKNLMSLPEEMDSLQQLRKLYIWNCPLLEQSCLEGGEQWHKISHIADICVNDRNARRILN